MSNNLTASIVCILNSADSTVGTGFDDGLIATCVQGCPLYTNTTARTTIGRYTLWA